MKKLDYLYDIGGLDWFEYWNFRNEILSEALDTRDSDKFKRTALYKELGKLVKFLDGFYLVYAFDAMMADRSLEDVRKTLRVRARDFKIETHKRITNERFRKTFSY